MPNPNLYLNLNFKSNFTLKQRFKGLSKTHFPKMSSPASSKTQTDSHQKKKLDTQYGCDSYQTDSITLCLFQVTTRGMQRRVRQTRTQYASVWMVISVLILAVNTASKQSCVLWVKGSRFEVGLHCKNAK